MSTYSGPEGVRRQQGMELKEGQLPITGSITATLAPVLGALIEAEEILGRDRLWIPTNPEQTEFLTEYFPNRSQLEQVLQTKSDTDPLRMASVASRSADVINKFLQERGFSITLPAFQRPQDFGTASVMDILVKWIFTGTSMEFMAANGRKYPAAKLKEVEIKSTDVNENPVVYIPTRHKGYSFGVTIPDQPIIDGFRLVDFVTRVQRSESYNDDRYDGLIIPKVNLDQQVDISWLAGMNTTSDKGVPAAIVRALQQTRFRMNEEGARAQSAVATNILLMGTSINKEPYVVNRPFVCWIQREDIDLPLFAGFIDYSDWKDPGSLS